MKNKIWAVIPAYNEESKITAVVKDTKKYVDSIIVVDDCSQDKTSGSAEKAGAYCIRIPINMGAGFATRIGCDLAYKSGARYIITLDADGQHDPADIPKLMDKLKRNNLDIVFGARPRNRNMPLIKKLGNSGLSMIARLLFRVKIHDSQTGFHAFTREAYRKIRWDSNRYGVVSEFVMRVGKARLRYGEAKVKTIYNDKIGMRKRDAVKSVFSMLKWRLKG